MSTIVKDGKVVHLPECYGKLHSFTEPVCNLCSVNPECERSTIEFNMKLKKVEPPPEKKLDESSPCGERLLVSLASDQNCYECGKVIPEYGASNDVPLHEKTIHNARKGFRHTKCPVTVVTATPST